jgi:4-amino-4-deoxy-L-arabinose transferase-like glycosyltransferase
MNKKQKALFIGIVLLAIFFRFYLISQMPGGLFPDMAANGLDINLMQQGHLQPFYERGNGREALFFYMEWASVAVFGKGVWQFSIVSALMGVLAVLMCYFVTYRLLMMGKDGDDPAARKKSTNIALLAMFLMAVSTWHIVLSRTAFRATLIPLFSALTVYFLLRAYQSVTTKTKLWFAFLCGASFALGFYTYIAFRIMAPILFMAIAWPLLAQLRYGKFWGTIKSYLLPFVIFAIAFVIFIFPIAKYFYQHPGSFVGRAGQVSIFNQTLYTVNGQQLTGTPPLKAVVSVAGEVFKVQFLGIFTKGDLNWRQNISGYPFLSPLVSPFFGGALIVIVILGIWYFFAPNKRKGWWKYFLLTGWFFGMMLPVITTAEGIPHGLRGIGIIPPLFIISAIGLYEFGTWIYSHHKHFWEYCTCHPATSAWEAAQKGEIESTRDHPHFLKFKILTWALKLVVVCFVAALILQTFFLYFVYAYNDDANFFAFRSDLTPVSQYLIDRCNKDNTFLVLDQFSVQTTDYLTSNRYGNFNDPCNVPYHQVDPEHAYLMPTILSGQQVVFTQSSMFDTVKFTQYHPEARLVLDVQDKFKANVLAVYEGQ